MPTPSITASKQPHIMPDVSICFRPPRIASALPVKNPAPTEYVQPLSPLKFKHQGHSLAFHGSSFFLIPFIAQSNVENNPPHTPKLPPSTGARALIAVRAPILLSPTGLFLKPLTPCQTAPPIAYREHQLASVQKVFDKHDGLETYTHTKSATEVIQSHPGTRISRVIHFLYISGKEGRSKCSIKLRKYQPLQ